MSEFTIDVSGMVCANCEQIVCDAVATVDAVSSVTADAAGDEVTVEGDPAAEPTVRRTIDDLGFEVDGD